jgi:hypothetical protein
MNEIWYSKEFDNAPMPHSVFFIKDGHAIHGSFEVRNLGKPVSHGCVRISPKNAATLYALVKENGLENTHVTVTGVSPGGEYGTAGAQASPRSDFSRLYLALLMDFRVARCLVRAFDGADGGKRGCGDARV